MKILIVSDTHRRNENYIRAVERVAPIDMVIHCGDIEGSEYLIAEYAGCPVQMVMGNNDFFADLPREKEFVVGTIKREARARGVDIVMYGHSHKPVVDLGEDVIAVNPGSLTYPRQEGRRPSFIIMDLDRKGEAHFTINYL